MEVAYQPKAKDYETKDTPNPESMENPQEFRPSYKILEEKFDGNAFSSRSCRCHPDRC